ncbi:MAG TPA: phosphotransferase [Polyangiaceae bacterium]|nr:phosphotransferase [Polyangiaceae bacterium]
MSEGEISMGTPTAGVTRAAPAVDLDLSPLAGLVAEAFGGPLPFAIEPMPGGASPRRYFRVKVPDRSASAVAFFVPDAGRPDEIVKAGSGARPVWPYLEVRELLHGRGVRVPALLADGSARGWLLVEDLGDETLAAFLAKNPGRKVEAYQRAVADLARAQSALERLPEGSVVASRVFDEDLLSWEVHHFREWALEARGAHLTAEERALFDELSTRLARRIASWPCRFVHRDYQSRNLMVCGGGDGGVELAWLDFQDALLGPRVYDLVALLNDSYQTFDRAFVEARLDEFAAAAGLGAAGRDELGRQFDLVTVQRKLKDAGRFVFLDRVKQNPSFLPFVEPTLEKARASMARLEGDDDVRRLAALVGRALGRVAP